MEQTEQKHTPTPWTVGSAKGYNANTIFDSDGNPVCQVYGIATNREVEEEKNAPGMPVALNIVKCVNSHAQLVAALEKAEGLRTAISTYYLSIHGDQARQFERLVMKSWEAAAKPISDAFDLLTAATKEDNK